MSELKDFVDISKESPLAPEQIRTIVENPGGLTKEGVEKKITLQNQSHNKYQKKMYQMMLKRCKNLATSGKTIDGQIILARRDGTITWTDKS